MNLLVVIVVHLLALAAALPTLPAGCPSIVSREEWGARSSRQIARRNPLSPFLMVHHGGIRSYCTTKEACSRIIRSYQDLHMDDRGWDDIGYSFLIGEDGNIYEGRGWDRIGAHAIKYNTNSIGVCFVGDFTDRLPEDVALQAFYKLVSCSIKMNFLPNNYTLLGHRQAKDTMCPGDSLFKEISQWPNWKNVTSN
ncbi:peptidoglycan-recognition protein SC2-like [Cloeon dipterum]|uniref:peptidoglycan-recognition protein SC2-like n=1 Tax=Cloeon dipterum TaxID=197152 RepID=UPI00322073CF